jgi:hypothetical protein
MRDQLTWPQHGTGGNSRRCKLARRIRTRSALAPQLHAIADDAAMHGARIVRAEAFVVQPAGFFHQRGPTPEQRFADHLTDDPAVFRREDIRRRGGEAAIAHANPVTTRQSRFRREGAAQHCGCREERPVDHLAKRRAEVAPENPGATRLSFVAAQINAARHRLSDRIERQM